MKASRTFFIMLALLMLVSTSACAQRERPVGPEAAPRSPTPRAGSLPSAVQLTDVARGLDHPWGLAFLPDNRLLVTERSGQLRFVARDGQVSEPLSGVPKVYASGQGGLLDVTLSPSFAQDRLVYLSFSEPGAGGAGTAVARGRLGERGLENTEVIWRQQPKVSGNNHWGSRLVWRPDGTLFVTVGDRYAYRERAQDPSVTLGKVIRINADGSIPKDNPFAGRAGTLPEIWSLGHRNVQAATLDAAGQLWTVEHGARGGDELNNPQPGRNYGWPIITYGVDYSGARIGEGTVKAGLEQPIYFWDPVIAPSGAVYYTGDAYPEWRGDLFIGSLQPGCLVRLKLSNNRVATEERYSINDGERVRNVRQGPDGLLYLLTDDADGRILRLDPRRN